MDPPPPEEGIPEDWAKCKARWQDPEAADCIWVKQVDFAMQHYVRTNRFGEIRGCSVSYFLEQVARYDLPSDVVSVFADRLPHRKYWPPNSPSRLLGAGGYDQCTSWEAYENPGAFEGIPTPCAVRIGGVRYDSECGNLEECRNDIGIIRTACILRYPTLD